MATAYHACYDKSGGVKSVSLEPREGSKPLEVPEDWEMFTKAGNVSLTKKARQFVERLAAGWTPAEAARKYVEAYRKTSGNKTMGEADDTAVRECVWDFLHRFVAMLPYGEQQLCRIWDGAEQ